MKFLLDENQSPAIVDLLAEAGHDAVHVRDLDMKGSPDVAVLAAASAADRVVKCMHTSRIGVCRLVPVRPQLCAKHQLNGMIQHETTSAGHALSRLRTRR